MIATSIEAKECRMCGKLFRPWSSTQVVCGPVCARRKVEADNKETKRLMKARKEKAKTTGELIEEAQKAFNAFIRLRDAGKPCICCGRPMELDILGQPKVNAGHWRTRGAAGHLRFDETNVHAQRVSCNRPGGANAGMFREGMIARIGLAAVERLECSNEVEQWDHSVLRQIKVIYLAKARALKRKHGLKLLIVDYLQLMTGTDTRAPRTYQLEEASRGLKALAKELQVPVIALAQVNRGVEKETDPMPRMSDLKDCGAIEQDADVILFLHRPWVVTPDLEAEWKYYAKSHLAKQRGGRTGYLHFTYVGEHTRFMDWPADTPIPTNPVRVRGKSGGSDL